MLKFDKKGKVTVHKIAHSEGYLTSKLLIATPRINDVLFTKAVIFICYHDENGAIGYMVNKNLSSFSVETQKITSLKREQKIVKDYLEKFKIKGDQIFFGGPMSPQRIFVLHTDLKFEKNAISYDDCELALCLNLGDNYPNQAQHDVIFGLGFSGWEANQLEQEINRNDWLVVDADRSLIFDKEPSNLWQKIAKKHGIDIKRVRNDAKNKNATRVH